jgi:hypothetical protein
MSILLLLLPETIVRVARLPCRAHKICLYYDCKFVNTKRNLFCKRQFAATVTGSQLGRR